MSAPSPDGSPLRLLTYQSLWAMEDLPFRGERQWTLAERVERIAGAGFDGLAVDLGAKQKPASTELAALLPGTGLRTAVFAFLDGDAALGDAIDYAEAIGARDMVVCGQVFDFDLDRLAAVVHRWSERCSAAGIRMQLETHRNTMTNDLRTTVRLLERLDPAVPLAIDLSHHVCGCELPDGHHPETEALVDRLLHRAGSLQGRVATRCQVQVPIDFPAHADAVARFRDWWTRGFAAIRQRRAARADVPDEVIFCCELGTRPYAIVGADGQELSDRWAEALTLRQWARQAFTESERLHAAGASETTADPSSSLPISSPAPVEIPS
ncbi:sugar phosphate isomerase/epimerase family protein [Nakamurella leprariae]|uniref:Sugar phosphate isomerase/epimerase n=1 Tax=Nakamurella leprariae TaxID=2803911 RepID=A0A938YH60_9ACTN|nr:sugar phosphate isomerase/epimerase [Nakamurella leprariae]MBM9469528.1 sugar phosphate isomerase/epimerase [Nakamurella leprariae]